MFKCFSFLIPILVFIYQSNANTCEAVNNFSLKDSSASKLVKLDQGYISFYYEYSGDYLDSMYAHNGQTTYEFSVIRDDLSNTMTILNYSFGLDSTIYYLNQNYKTDSVYRYTDDFITRTYFEIGDSHHYETTYNQSGNLIRYDSIFYNSQGMIRKRFENEIDEFPDVIDCVDLNNMCVCYEDENLVDTTEVFYVSNGRLDSTIYNWGNGNDKNIYIYSNVLETIASYGKFKKELNTFLRFDVLGRVKNGNQREYIFYRSRK